MSIFSAIGSALFGGSETANKTIDAVTGAAKGIGTWIDERNFTEEEKSKADQATLNMVLKMVEVTQDENSTRSVTRRYLAWGIMGSYLSAFISAFTIGYFKPDFATHVLDAVAAFQIGHLAFAVGSFYFLASITRSMKK